MVKKQTNESKLLQGQPCREHFLIPAASPYGEVCSEKTQASISSFPLKHFLCSFPPKMGDNVYGNSKNTIMEKLLNACFPPSEIGLHLPSLRDVGDVAEKQTSTKWC